MVQKGKFKAIIYLISFTVVLTVSIQVYRNIENYQYNQQQLINDVQLSLDNAIEAYYADLAKDEDLFRVISRNFTPSDSSGVRRMNRSWVNGHSHGDPDKVDSLLKRMNLQNAQRSSGGTVKFSVNSSVTVDDSLMQSIDPANISSVKIFRDTAASLVGFSTLANNLVISMTRPLEMEGLSKYVSQQLEEKGLDLDFALLMTSLGEEVDSYNDPDNPRFVLSTTPKSTYEFDSRSLEMRFDNASMAVLKRGGVDLLISLLISIVVIGALLYLYKVINQQKQLAEIKNDLISNITHEFKTPIATVASAIEGIVHFNDQNDPGKTRKYLDISKEQLKKLNLMVEKLLETATLETDAVELEKSPVNLSQVIHTMIERYRMVSQDKQIDFKDHSQDAIIEADAFHLENAISNLIDNAIKYGGDQIMVTLAYQQGSVQVIVQDNGGNIDKGQKERVFDKFYRIPKGNQHDVKGFGIGLYYTRKIIEKHGGTIELILSPQQTSFEVAI